MFHHLRGNRGNFHATSRIHNVLYAKETFRVSVASSAIARQPLFYFPLKNGPWCPGKRMQLNFVKNAKVADNDFAKRQVFMPEALGNFEHLSVQRKCDV